MASSMPISSAEVVIREAASRIGITDNESSSVSLSQICQRMKEEFVIEDWQLSEIGCSQWRELGAPIGLAAAVRKILLTYRNDTRMDNRRSNEQVQKNRNHRSRIASEDDDDDDDNDATLMGSLLKSSRLIASSNSASKSTTALPTSKKSLNGTCVHEKIIKEDANAIGDNPIEHIASHPEQMDKRIEPEQGHTSTPETTHTTRRRKQRHYNFPNSLLQILQAFPIRKFGRPFPMQDIFYRGLLHSKSGQELKAHGLFVMELSVVVSALLTGAAVELWGAFPFDSVVISREGGGGGVLGTDEDGQVPQMLALVFNSMSCAALLIQFFCTMGWILFLNVAAAISPEKYAKFMQQTRYIHSKYWFLMEAGSFAFVSAVGILFTAMVWATTSPDDTVLRYTFGIGFPAIVITPVFACLNAFTTYIGKVAFHGFLLPHRDIKGHLNQTDGSLQPKPGRLAKKVERDHCETFYDHIEYDVDKVLDILCIDDEVEVSCEDIMNGKAMRTVLGGDTVESSDSQILGARQPSIRLSSHVGYSFS